MLELWEMNLEPRAPELQFPRDAAVAGGFIFWQKCFRLYRHGGSVNSFWCALTTSLPASCRSHAKNSQIPSPAHLWAVLTNVRSCEEKSRGWSDGFVSYRGVVPAIVPCWGEPVALWELFLWCFLGAANSRHLNKPTPVNTAGCGLVGGSLPAKMRC